MLSFMKSLLGRRDETGASSVEYGLLAVAIAALVVVVVVALGGVVQEAFGTTCDSFEAKAQTGSTCTR